MAQPSGSKGPSRTPRSAADAETETSIETLKRLGKYQLQKKIGAGGMGTVFLAVDSNLNRAVALKVLARDKASNPTLVKRFKSEAQSAANLRHENIVMVYEAGEADGLLYIALEYVEGTDVANIVFKRGVMPVKRSLEVIRQVALALQHAHSQGIVHRDIKPANILIRRDGMVKLADLGLARAVDDHTDTSITRVGTTVGTIDYMAPEQARDSKAADFRSDLYSLGCTWYYMLTGEAPFPNGSMTNKLRSHAESPLPDPRTLNPSVSEAVIAVIRRMTEKDPKRRYQTPDELLSDLETARVASDIVSATILDENDDDRTPTPAVRKSSGKRGAVIDDRPVGERPRSRPNVADDVTSTPPAWKPPRQDREKKPSELGRAITFYAVVVLLVGGVLVGLGWLVQRFGSAVDAPANDAVANPFAGAAVPENPANAANAVNAVRGDGTTIHGAGPAEGDRNRSVTGDAAASGQTIQGQTAATRIGPAGDAPQDRVIDGTAAEPKRTIVTGSAADSPATKPPGNDSAGDPSKTGDPSGTKGSAPGRTGRSPEATVAAEKRRANEDTLLPSWSTTASAPLSPPGLARLIVRRGVSDAGRFSSINAALEQVPAEGAVITLEGQGPFPLSPARITGKSRILIQAENGASSGEPPLVVLHAADGARSGSGLEFVDTAAEFHNIHLALSPAPSGESADAAIIHIRGGHLTLRNSSITVPDAAASSLAAIRLSAAGNRPASQSASPMRVLIDQTVIRGESLTALDVDVPEVDLVVRRSLIWSGKAAALRFAGIADGTTNARKVQLVSSTVCSQSSAVRIAGNPARPVATTIEWINSLAAAPEGAKSAALCVFEGWNSEQQQQALGKSLNWKSIDTLYLGWNPLLRLEPEGAIAAADIGDWIRAWKDKTAGGSGQFQETGWASAAVADVVRAPTLAVLAPETVGKSLVKTKEGGWPGCAPELLTLASLSALESPFAAANRLPIPLGLFDGPVTAEVIRVDLTKDDLGKVLAERKPPHGAQIIASGFGARQSSPIVIHNVWLRLKFEQTDGAPLVLSPRGTESARPSEGNVSGDAFIVVNHGGLEVTGGAFTMPTSERTPYPRWFLQAIDSDLAFRHCRIQAPLLAGARGKGLIQWLRSDGSPPARPFSGSLDGYAAFENCCLFGSGTLIEADLLKQAMFFRNCLLVARDDLLSIHLRGGGTEIAATVDFETTTLSAAGKFFKVTAAALDAPATVPLRVFVDRCVFGPPLPSGTQKTEPTLLSYSGPLLEARQLDWLENRCGYAPDIASFLRSETAPAKPQEFRDVWLKQWGPAQVVESLTGPQGVVLAKDLPQRNEDRARLEPADFALYPSSRAATWDGQQGPIGAPLAEIRFPPLRAAAGSTPTKPKTPKPTKPSPNRNAKPAF